MYFIYGNLHTVYRTDLQKLQLYIRLQKKQKENRDKSAVTVILSNPVVTVAADYMENIVKRTSAESRSKKMYQLYRVRRPLSCNIIIVCTIRNSEDGYPCYNIAIVRLKPPASAVVRGLESSRKKNLLEGATRNVKKNFLKICDRNIYFQTKKCKTNRRIPHTNTGSIIIGIWYQHPTCALLLRLGTRHDNCCFLENVLYRR